MEGWKNSLSKNKKSLTFSFSNHYTLNFRPMRAAINYGWIHNLQRKNTTKEKRMSTQTTGFARSSTNIAIIWITPNHILLPQNKQCPLLQTKNNIPEQLQESRGFLFLFWPKNLPLISMKKKNTSSYLTRTAQILCWAFDKICKTIKVFGNRQDIFATSPEIIHNQNKTA